MLFRSLCCPVRRLLCPHDDSMVLCHRSVKTVRQYTPLFHTPPPCTVDTQQSHTKGCRKPPHHTRTKNFSPDTPQKNITLRFQAEGFFGTILFRFRKSARCSDGYPPVCLRAYGDRYRRSAKIPFCLLMKSERDMRQNSIKNLAKHAKLW